MTNSLGLKVRTAGYEKEHFNTGKKGAVSGESEGVLLEM
jgi:hypothetical protein